MTGDIWGDIPTWILAIFTPISIFVGFWASKQEDIKTSKIEEQKFFFEVNKLLTNEDSLYVRNKINAELEDNEIMNMDDYTLTMQLNMYLNNLEFICNLYQKGLVSLTMIDDFVGIRITNVMKCKSVQDYIARRRGKVDSKLWVMIKEVYDDLNKIKVENGITRYPDGTRVDSHGKIIKYKFGK